MRGSVRIARLFGINIYVHWTFIFLIGFVAFAFSAGGVGKMVEGVVFAVLLFACVAAHELGHSLAAKRYGIPTRDITLLPIGGVARIERMPKRPSQELVVAAAGPAVNLVIGPAILAALAAAGRLAPPQLVLAELGEGFSVWTLLSRLGYVNLILVVFNLIPAFPMDGGRILRAILATFMDHTKATGIAALVGQAIAGLFFVVGILPPMNPVLLLIALFVFFGAQQEATAATREAAIEGIAVREAMITRFRTLRRDDSVQSAIDELLAGSQTDFPVADEGRVVGIVTRDGLIRALAEGRGQGRVAEVMRSDHLAVEDDEMLVDVLPRMQGKRLTALVVVRGGAVVGLLTHENIGEMMMVNAAVRQARGRRANGPARGVDVAGA